MADETASGARRLLVAPTRHRQLRADRTCAGRIPVPVGDIAGNGRGDLIAVAGFDAVTRVFDTATGTQLGRELTGNLNLNMNFAGDGTTLLVQEDDHVSIWNNDRATWPELACELAGRNLTREEWEGVGPRTVEYRATCPQFPIDT